jgi:hypothetical protein
VGAAISSLLSGEHFSVDGTLIQAWAGHKSFVLKDRHDGDDSDGGNFRNQQRSNETHESKTDGDARLYRKGKTASELRFRGHMRQVLVRGLEKVDQMFVLTMAAYNLTRVRTLGQVRLQGGPSESLSISAAW